MATVLQNKMVELNRLIIQHDYYQELWVKTLSHYGVKPEELGELPDGKIVALANIFWQRLPDVKAIRREPFWKLCGIAEHIFDKEAP